jgi:phenylacetate-coenzyme A ligase PaaK-like adenylate-forming protein
VGAGDLRSLRDVERMPWTFIQSMKEHELLSVPREEIVLTLTSSGTAA